MPADTDFEPVTDHAHSTEVEEILEEDFDDFDYGDEMFVEFETFDDVAFEKMLAAQKDMNPEAFELAVEAKMAEEKAASLTVQPD